MVTLGSVDKTTATTLSEIDFIILPVPSGSVDQFPRACEGPVAYAGLKGLEDNLESDATASRRVQLPLIVLGGR